jgi:LacI family transcriptional regulator
VVPTLENSIFAKGIQSPQSRLASKHITLPLARSNYDLDHDVVKIRELVSHRVDELVLIGISRCTEVFALLVQD